MNIGIHAYIPGLTGSVDSTTGMARTVRFIIDSYQYSGHDVYWLAPEHVPDTVAVNSSIFMSEGADAVVLALVEECDVIILMWRWLMPAPYKDRNDAYFRQMDILRRAYDLGIPVIIHDQDMTMTREEISELSRWDKCLLTMPAIIPGRPFKTLHYPDAFAYDQVVTEAWGQRNGCIYIGNNYGRYNQSLEYFNRISRFVQTNVWGNWLDDSPYRESPEQVLFDFPNVNFCGRIDQKDMASVMPRAKMTVHLAKPEMNEVGFMAVRWSEAAHFGVPAIIPAEFRLWHHYGELGGQVPDPIDSGDMACELDQNKVFNQTIWESQHSFVKRTMRFQPWLDVVKQAVTL